MRIRTIKPEFWRSVDVSGLSRDVRLLFIGLWSYVDDNGVGIDDHRQVTADLFPLEDDPVEAREYVREGLATLSRRFLIERYEVDGKHYLAVTGWRHQKVDKPNNPRYPTPDRATKPSSDSVSRASREPSRDARDHLAPVTGEQGNRGTEEPAPSELALVPAPAATAAPTDSAAAVTKRAQALATTYRDKVGSLANFVAVMKIAKAALEDSWTDDAVEAALLRLADDQRPVTKDSLRYELVGPPKPRRSNRPKASDRASRTLTNLSEDEQGRVS